MLVKCVVLLFCCALINAKSLVQKDPRHEKFEHEKLPSSFIDIIHRRLSNAEEIEPRLGAELQAKNEEVDELTNNEEDDEEESEEELDDEQIVPELNEKTDVKKVKNEEKEDEAEDESNTSSKEDEEEEEDDEVDNKAKNEEKETSQNADDEDDDDDDENNDNNELSNNDDNASTAESNDENEVANEESQFEPDEEFRNSKQRPSAHQTPNENDPKAELPHLLVGNGDESPKSFKFPKDQLNLLSPFELPQSSVENFDSESFLNGFQSLKKFLPNEESKKMKKNNKKDDLNADEGLLLKAIGDYESKTFDEENSKNPAPSFFNFNRDSFNNFIPKTIPKNMNDLRDKFQQLKDLWQDNFNGHFKPNSKPEPKVGFGGWKSHQTKPKFADLTNYVSKVVDHAQAQLEGRTISANNPPLTINLIPGTPITLKLKRVEGVDSIEKHGQSKAIHFNKLYAFTQYKFTELRYYYDVEISPLNVFGISKSIIIILNDAPAKMNLSVDKDSKFNIMGLEFVNPTLSLDLEGHRFLNYAVNYLINDVAHPVVKQKLVEIVSRDSKLLLTNYLKDAQ